MTHAPLFCVFSVRVDVIQCTRCLGLINKLSYSKTDHELEYIRCRSLYMYRLGTSSKAVVQLTCKHPVL